MLVTLVSCCNCLFCSVSVGQILSGGQFVFSAWSSKSRLGGQWFKCWIMALHTEAQHMQRRIIPGFCPFSHPQCLKRSSNITDLTVQMGKLTEIQGKKAVIAGYMLGSLVDWESVFRSSVSAVCVWLLLDNAECRGQWFRDLQINGDLSQCVCGVIRWADLVKYVWENAIKVFY